MDIHSRDGNSSALPRISSRFWGVFVGWDIIPIYSFPPPRGGGVFVTPHGAVRHSPTWGRITGIAPSPEFRPTGAGDPQGGGGDDPPPAGAALPPWGRIFALVAEKSSPPTEGCPTGGVGVKIVNPALAAGSQRTIGSMRGRVKIYFS